MIKNLLSHGAKVNSRTKIGATPLMEAVIQGHFNAIKFLLEHGADPDIQDIGGASSIHLAIRGGNQKIIEILLKNSSMNEMIDMEGFTPSMRAVVLKKTKSFEQLIANDAVDFSKVNDYGQTVEQLAKISNNKDILNLITSKKNYIANLSLHDFDEEKYLELLLYQKSANYVAESVDHSATILVSEAVKLPDNFDPKSFVSSDKEEAFIVEISNFESDEEINSAWSNISKKLSKKKKHFYIKLEDQKLVINKFDSANEAHDLCKSINSKFSCSVFSVM